MHWLCILCFIICLDLKDIIRLLLAMGIVMKELKKRIWRWKMEKLQIIIIYRLMIVSLYGYVDANGQIISNYSSSNANLIKLSVDKIGQYKQNQHKISQILLMMRQDIPHKQLLQLQKYFLNAIHRQYLKLYNLPKFCNICEIIKLPRTSHCYICDKCVLRRQKHSQMIGMCVGLGNIKIFAQYLFISLIISLYMCTTMLFIASFQAQKVNKLDDIPITIFGIFWIILLACVLLFLKQFVITYCNIVDNITQQQRKVGAITRKNNPFYSEKYYEKLFKAGKIDLLRLDDIADPSNWLQFNQQEVQIEEIDDGTQRNAQQELRN